MILHRFLSVLVLVVRAVNAVEMAMWTGQDPGAWTNEPTWHAEVEMPANTVLNYLGVLAIAHAHYDWLVLQPGTTTSSDSGTRLVAAMWDPNSQMVFLSTVPVGPRKAAMAQSSISNGAAPLWYNLVQGFVRAIFPSPPGINAFHAEDGVFFNWETSTYAQTANGQYPLGSLLAVWGVYGNSPAPSLVNLCSTQKAADGSAGRTPTCQDVARGLGVQFTANPLPQPPPQQIQDQNSDEEYGEPITEEEYDAGMAMVNCANPPSKKLAIRGRSPIRRDNTSACVPISFPTTFSATPLSITLDPSDYGTSTGSPTMTEPPVPTTTLGLIYDG
jgi:hypothetical protein